MADPINQSSPTTDWAALGAFIALCEAAILVRPLLPVEAQAYHRALEKLRTAQVPVPNF